MPTVEERVSSLEKVLEDFIISVRNAQIQTETEIRALKDEMKAFKDEMRAFKDEMKVFKDEMKAFKDEMKAFKDEMTVFRDETREENKKRNKEWSNLAKKMGTLYEDLIAPAIRPVLSNYFNCDVTMEGQRMFRRIKGDSYEVDAIASCDDKVFMIEVRSTPRVKDVDEIKKKGEEFFRFFPELKDKKLYIIFGSITFPDDVLKYASKKGIYAMGWREWEYMDILNFQEVKI